MDVSKETLTEKVSGNLTTSLAVTAIGSITAGPLGAILGVLVNTLANGRYKQRVEGTLQELAVSFKELEKKIDSISDAQYKLINESLVTIHQTIEEEKLSYLKNSIYNAIALENITHHQASIISRIIRDISAREAKFLIERKFNNEEYASICLDLQAPPPQSTSHRNGGKVTANIVIEFKSPIYVKNGVLHVSGGAEQIDLLNGLIALGLLIPSKITEGGQYYNYAPIVAMLRNLLESPEIGG